MVPVSPPVNPRGVSRVCEEDRARVALVVGHTVRERAPLVPELTLRVARELTPIWEVTEAVGVGPQPPPFWAFPWVGGQALARFILDRPELVQNRRVLDFATGGGLVALAAARAGAALVTAVDIDPLAIAAAAVNARENGLKLDLICADVVGQPLVADVILTGDICYDRAAAAHIAAWLFRLAGHTETVLMGDGGRAFLPTAGLRLEARFEVATTLEIESAEQRTASVWRVLAETGTEGLAPDR